MTRIPQHKTAVCEEARRLALTGSIPRNTLPFIELAEEGSEDAFTIVLRTVCNSGLTRRELSHFIELPAKARPRDAGQFFAASGDRFGAASDYEDIQLDAVELRLKPHIAERVALKRALGLSLAPLPSSHDFETLVFEGIEYSRDMIAEAGGHTIEDNVRAAIAARLARIAINSLAADNNALFFPPPPSSRKFPAMMLENLDVDRCVFEEWMRWPSWNMVLAPIFVATLSYGLVPGIYPTAIDERRAKIASMQLWFDDLAARGITPALMESAFNIVFKPHNVRERMKAVAELSLFTSEIDRSILDRPEAAALLALDINILHDTAPQISGRDFLRLLTPYAPPMDIQSITTALKRRGMSAHRLMIYRAYLKLFWHAAPPDDLAEALEWLISHNRAFNDLDRLLGDRLAVDSDALFDKIGKMRAAGANVSPLLRAIAKKFPDSSRRTPDFVEAIPANDGSAAPPPLNEAPSDEHAAVEVDSTVEEAQLDLPGLGILAGGIKMGR